MEVATTIVRLPVVQVEVALVSRLDVAVLFIAMIKRSFTAALLPRVMLLVLALPLVLLALWTKATAACACFA